MGPWASAIIAVAIVAAIFFAVMAFRGLMQVLDSSAARCAQCGRAAMLPLSSGHHECRRCHDVRLSLTHPLEGLLRLRH